MFLFLCFLLFFFSLYACHRDLHSFPTRRSSDLGNGFAVYGDLGLTRVLPEVHPSAVAVARLAGPRLQAGEGVEDRKSTRLNSSHGSISYAVFCLKKKRRVARQNTFLNRTLQTHR